MRHVVDELLGQIPNSYKNKGLLCDDIQEQEGFTFIKRTYQSHDGKYNRKIIITIPTELYNNLESKVYGAKSDSEKLREKQELYAQIGDLVTKKEDAVENQNFEEAAILRDKIAKLKNKLDEL